MKRFVLRVLVLLILGGMALHLPAATFTVTHNGGTNSAGSLLRALHDANATPLGAGEIHIIEFSANFVITLDEAPPQLTKPVMINAVSPRIVTVQTQWGFNSAFDFGPGSEGSWLVDVTVRCTSFANPSFCFRRGVVVRADDVTLWRVNVDHTGFNGISITDASGAVLSQVRVTRTGMDTISFTSSHAIRCVDSPGLYVQSESVIGLDTSNQVAGANGSGRGISLENCDNAVISNNTISGNGGHGISVTGGSGVVIRGNQIGTTPTGVSARGNGGAGILVLRANNLMIGGTSSAHTNIIAANADNQILVNPAGGSFVQINGLTIQRNFIGSNATNTALGSSGHGILVEANNSSAGNNLVGMVIGSSTNVNTIARNSGYGIRINSPSARVRIWRNSILLNMAGAISSDAGPAAPQLSSLTETTLRGTAPTPPAGATGRIDIYADHSGQAQHFVGTVTNVNIGSWEFSPSAGNFSAHEGRRLSATFTQIQDGTYRTTELSDLDIVVGGPKLTVTRAGTGSGYVTSAPTGIFCGTECSVAFPEGRVISITAHANSGSTFTGWSGACSGTGPNCFVTGGQALTAIANFAADTVSHNLTVTRSGTGSGTVTSSPGGINCGTSCSAAFAQGTTVTLTAAVPAGSTFAGWSGEGCSGTGTCVVTMSQARSVTASFTLVNHQLSVNKTGSGQGTVTSSPAGINCGTSCTAAFAHGTTVTLTAAVPAGSTFAGWSGEGCSGTGTCVVTMSQARSVTASFTLTNHQLSVNKTGGGQGTVTSSPAGINCGSTCQANFADGTTVTLAASAASGSSFTGWSGSGCTGTGTCTVTMSEARNVSARFDLAPQSLTVNKTGSGAGRVLSNPEGIDCGSTCTASFAHSTMVTLTAVPNTASTFTGWSGSGCTGTGSCTVNMNQARTVSANFQSTGGEFQLSVIRKGNGEGSVSSAPAGISCGSPSGCQASFAANTEVTLTATPQEGYIFSGWSGGGCEGIGSCVVTMDESKTVAAVFNTTDTIFHSGFKRP